MEKPNKPESLSRREGEPENPSRRAFIEKAVITGAAIASGAALVYEKIETKETSTHSPASITNMIHKPFRSYMIGEASMSDPERWELVLDIHDNVTLHGEKHLESVFVTEEEYNNLKLGDDVRVSYTLIEPPKMPLIEKSRREHVKLETGK